MTFECDLHAGDGETIIEARGRPGDENGTFSAIVWLRDIGAADRERRGAQRQAAPSDRQRSVGLGLGLAKSFIELHGGRVKLQSALGEGTKVTCYLPPKQIDAASAAITFGTSSGVTSTISVAFMRTWARLSLRSLRASFCRVESGRCRKIQRLTGLRR